MASRWPRSIQGWTYEPTFEPWHERRTLCATGHLCQQRRPARAVAARRLLSPARREPVGVRYSHDRHPGIVVPDFVAGGDAAQKSAWPAVDGEAAPHARTLRLLLRRAAPVDLYVA